MTLLEEVVRDRRDTLEAAIEREFVTCLELLRNPHNSRANAALVQTAKRFAAYGFRIEPTTIGVETSYWIYPEPPKEG